MITALWLAVVLLVQTPGQISNSTFKVNGMIIREDGREPDRVSDADRVLLRGNGVSKVFDIDTGGAFEFTNVRPGSYEIVVGPRVSMEPVKVVVTDKDVSGVRVVVPDRVILSGTVMMDASGPSPRFQLSFTRMDGPAPSGPVRVTAATTFTAALSPGQYRVTTDGLPNSFTLKSMTLDTTDVLAQPMKLTSGDSPSLSVMLGVAAPAPWVKVAGRIVGGNAGPVPPGSVSMSGAAILETLTAPVQSDGSFEFPKVLPGIYDVRTLPVTVLSADSTLTVGPADLTNFQLRTPQPIEIKGRILIQGDVPMPRLAFSVGGATVPANPQPGGSFTIALPEGERQISIVPTSIPAGYTLTSLTYGTTDLLKNPIRSRSRRQRTIECCIQCNLRHAGERPRPRDRPFNEEGRPCCAHEPTSRFRGSFDQSRRLVFFFKDTSRQLRRAPEPQWSLRRDGHHREYERCERCSHQLSAGICRDRTRHRRRWRHRRSTATFDRSETGVRKTCYCNRKW